MYVRARMCVCVCVCVQRLGVSFKRVNSELTEYFMYTDKISVIKSFRRYIAN